MSLDLTPPERHAVQWAIALVKAVATRAVAEGRQEVSIHADRIPSLEAVKVVLEASFVKPADVRPVAQAVTAACALYSNMPTDIWTLLDPPERSVMECARTKLENYLHSSWQILTE
ncbi:hypothetical protein [Deinococcus cavernae]|uniref:hypothetical protein n=1 Tax=Deinococcus cavernae TaxID=2320857 RepID=UPI0011C21ABB|nr:hypothetical protein [Deinococcus cavernae]